MVVSLREARGSGRYQLVSSAPPGHTMAGPAAQALDGKPPVVDAFGRYAKGAGLQLAETFVGTGNAPNRLKHLLGLGVLCGSRCWLAGQTGGLSEIAFNGAGVAVGLHKARQTLEEMKSSDDQTKRLDLFEDLGRNYVQTALPGVRLMGNLISQQQLCPTCPKPVQPPFAGRPHEDGTIALQFGVKTDAPKAGTRFLAKLPGRPAAVMTVPQNFNVKAKVGDLNNPLMPNADIRVEPGIEVHNAVTQRFPDAPKALTGMGDRLTGYKFDRVRAADGEIQFSGRANVGPFHLAMNADVIAGAVPELVGFPSFEAEGGFGYQRWN